MNNITISLDAVNHIQSLLDKRGFGLGLRIGIKKSGCSGYAYQLDFVDNPTEEDQTIAVHGINIYINKSDLPVLSGLELGLKTDKFVTEFTFNNNNVTGACGCGKSFTIK